jgi:hypothetical protein
MRTFDQEMNPLVNLNVLNIGVMVEGRAYDPRKKQYLIQPLRKAGRRRPVPFWCSIPTRR